MNMIFDVMNKHDHLCHVEIKDDTVAVDIVKRTVFCPFQFDNVTTKDVIHYFESRCYSIGRPDLPFILDGLGLDKYDPIEMVKKTHGRKWGDFSWIKFENEEITWEDLQV